jgi:hypothetical protein
MLMTYAPSAMMRAIFAFSPESAKTADCVAERGGFEPSRTFIFAGVLQFEGHFDSLVSPRLGQNLREILRRVRSPLLDDGPRVPGSCESTGAWVRPAPFC